MTRSIPNTSSPTSRAGERLREAERHGALRFSWAVLGSVWVHILVAGVVLVANRCAPGPEPSAQTALLLVPPEGSERPGEAAAPDAPSASEGTSRPDLAQLDLPSLLAELDGLDPDVLDAMVDFDPEEMELEPAEIEALLDAVDPETLARLAASLPPADPRLLALQELRARLQTGLAATPDRPARAEDADRGMDGPQPDADEEAPGFDPNDAVADAVLPDPAALEKSPEEREDIEVPEREEPDEPEPEPEDEAPTRFDRYLRADETQRRAEHQSNRFISSREARAEELRQVEVTSEVEGMATPPLDGLPIASGTPSLDLADGEPDEDGGDAPAAGEPVPERVVAERGGGFDGEEAGRGSPMDGEGKRGGAPSRSGRRAAATTSAILLAGDAAPREGYKRAPRPDDALPSRAEGWWSPKVARMVVIAPEVTPAEAPITAALDLQQVAEAPEPRPDDRDDRGGTEQPVEVDEALPESPDEAPEVDEGEAEPIEEVEPPPEEPVESIADLRVAMGWGGMEKARSKPRRSMPGIATTDGNLRTSLQTTSTELLTERLSLVDAADTAVGRYRAKLDEEITQQWHTMDLSLHERALGLQGDVSVVFIIERNGKVSEKTITRSSGNASLDAMALDAISEKLLKFPKDLDRTSIVHEYNFIYRNPIIVSGSP